jgi:hypothetical protein
MFKRSILVAFFVVGGLVLVSPTARAGTPFGGDDSGTIPTGGGKGPAGKCEDAIGGAVGKAVSCIGKCTASRADGKLADDTAEDNCEKNLAGKSCLEKFQAAAAKAQSKAAGACSCVSVATLTGVIEGDLDSMNNNVYCDTTSGTPFGGDDTGDIPVAKSATAKCEDGVNKLVGKAVACIIGCHKKRADGKLADDTAEDACEKNLGGKSCLEKFLAGVTKAQNKVPGACSCIDGASLASTIETTLDAGNGLTYCASPSGAFVDGMTAGF